jgi:hypothetical protein
MAFQDAVASGLAGAPTPDNSLQAQTGQPAAVASTPPPPAPAAQPASRPAATPAPAAPAPAAEDRTPGAFFHSLSRAFAGSVLGGLAGGHQTVDRYESDDTGKMKAVMRPLHPSERLQLLAQSALQGLASGAAVPPQRSAAASWLTGIGAGAGAVRQQAQQQDLLKRQQAKEDLEEQQKTLLHKATIASVNATTHATWQKFGDDENAKDTERTRNMSELNDLQDYITQNPQEAAQMGLKTQTLTEDQLLAARQADKNFAATHIVLPIGKVMAKDQDGNDVYEKDGVTPKFARQFGIITTSPDGTIPLPQAKADAFQKYSQYDPRLKSAAQLKAGNMVPVSSYIASHKFITEDAGKEADGWKNATPVMVNGKLMQHNAFTNETREYVGGVPLAVGKEQADIDEKSAQAEKLRADAAKARKEADAEASFNPPASSGLTGDDYLKTLPQAQQNVLRAIAEGRESRSPRQLQDKNGNPTPLAEALHRAYPDFDDKKAAAYGALVKDFTTGPTSRVLTAYGQTMSHARALYDNTGPKSYIPGTAENKRYNQDVTYVATEVAKALNPTGMATESAIKEQEDALRSYANRKEAIENAEHILTGKMAEIKQRWLNGQVRPSYQPPMPGLSQEAMDNADYVRNHGKVVKPQQNTQNAPAGASQEVYAANGTTLIGHVVNNKFVPLGQ